MSQTSTPPGPAQRARPRIWQLALVLNVFFPPAGYAYVGAWRTAGVFAVGVILAIVGITEATIAFPPGLYVQGVPGVVVLALCLAVALGVHAAWMAEDTPPKAGSRVRNAAVYGLTSLVVLTAAQGVRAYWPHAFYTMETSGMAPTLARGDLMAVRGRLGACEGPAPTQGDVVLYRRGEYLYLHRVVAGPGQTVAMRAGELSVDGRPVGRHGVDRLDVEFSEQQTLVVEETLANGRRFTTYDAEPDGVFDEFVAMRVPAEHWFVIGDDRDNSFDSRARGAIARRDICGVAFRIITHRDQSRVGREP